LGLACVSGVASAIEIVGTRGYAAPERSARSASLAQTSDPTSTAWRHPARDGRRPPTVGEETWGAGWGLETTGCARRAAAACAAELGDIVRQATAWEPEARIPAVNALRRAVEAYLAGA